MRALTLSGVIAAMPIAAIAVERTPSYHDCGRGPLDLPCASERRQRRPGTLGPVDERHADKAYVIRFGGSGEHDTRPSWDVRLGNWARQALFWAAVVTTFLL
jgi:hypothetical protein